jgi:hypothetical protein
MLGHFLNMHWRVIGILHWILGWIYCFVHFYKGSLEKMERKPMNNRKGGNQVVLDLLPPARAFSMFGGMDYAAVAQRIRRIEHDQAMQRR